MIKKIFSLWLIGIVAFTWDAPTDYIDGRPLEKPIEYYKLYRKIHSRGLNWSVTPMVTTPQTSFNLRLADHTFITYDFAVTAVLNGHESAKSNVVVYFNR